MATECLEVTNMVLWAKSKPRHAHPDRRSVGEDETPRLGVGPAARHSDPTKVLVSEL